MRREAQKQMEQERKQNYEITRGDEFFKEKERGGTYRSSMNESQGYVRDSPERYYGEQYWRTYGYDDDYFWEKKNEYPIGQRDGWTVELQEKCGRWETQGNNRYQVEHAVNLEVNQRDEEEEDEFEQFLNGPFAKK